MYRFAPLALAFALGCRPAADTDTGTHVDTGTPPVDADGDGFTEDEDCDDADPAVNPSATEVCDGVDNDCDGLVDNDAADVVTFYADADGDGYGDSDVTVEACAVPEGHVAQDGDCDDSDAAFHPGAAEDDCADPADYNCDGSVQYADADADGFAACEDCDDNNAAINPAATEICNGLDDDCDGLTDDADDDVDPSSQGTFYADNDGDTYGDPGASTTACEAPTGYVSDASDCDDADSARNPDTVWYADADGDTYGTSLFTTSQCEAPTGYVSNDADCDDLSADVHPGATERCNGIDDNCDGDIDGDDAVDKSTFYRDADGDTYGDPSSTTDACDVPSGYVSDASDCDDSDATLNPLTTWYADADADGYGHADVTKTQCDKPAGYVRVSGDCDDDASHVNPGASPVCDDVDTDCDGAVDFDADGDGYSDSSCGGLDCDDADASVYACGGTPETAGLDCASLLEQIPSATSGRYWIDPDGDDDRSDAFEVHCDMETAGGGWAAVWWVDGAHFDGTFGNDKTRNDTPPTTMNAQRDVWNIPNDMTASEVLYACTDDDGATSWWRYDEMDSYDWYANTTTDYQYQNIASASTSGAQAGGCHATHKGTANYGFMVIQPSGCGNCSNMLWGNYHYTSGGQCNSTDNSKGLHPSPWNGRNIGYPLCNKKQTAAGEFWIAVR